ncbi:MAG: hypothetical protein IJT24_03830 [Lachnospiraceae bacterium]|nr:hypothetical protein [Lachnospiraceae bacterium]
MSEENLQIGDIQKKKEALNKTKGINTDKAVFMTKESDSASDNPYAMSSRVEQLANYGPLMQSRLYTKNPNDIGLAGRAEGNPGEGGEMKVRSSEEQQIIKAQPDLKVFSGEVMKKGAFTPKAKEAARHFFRQISDWAGSFDDGGSGFYSEMGISSILDCLYVDGMRLRNYLNEQYYYKTTGNPAQDTESLRNYVALIAARGEHIITLVRPVVKGDAAEVEYKNLYVDLSEVGGAGAEKSRKQKEKGNQVRSDLKKRMDDDITERTGRAYRKAYGHETDGFKRIEGAKDGLKDVQSSDTEELKEFNKCFDRYNGGLQKLGLKPDRDDINLPVAEELKNRCEAAIEAAEDFLRSGRGSEEAVKAVKNAKKALETDRELLSTAIETKLVEEGARMRLDEMLDGSADDDKGRKPDGTVDDDSDI